MKTQSPHDNIRAGLSRSRLAAAGTLFLAAAGLAATAMQRPTLPWAVPTVKVGIAPLGLTVDRVTNTIYVANAGGNSLSVIDGGKCKAANASLCSPIARLTHVGPSPRMLAFDQPTGTLYVTDGLTRTGADGNTIAVLNGKTCNSTNTSGCGQIPAAILTVPGVLANQETGVDAVITLDSSNHTLYAGDANDGPVLMVNTATCNAMNTSGCSQLPSTMANGDAVAIDDSNHSVYVIAGVNDQAVSLLNGATCNATTQSDCTQFSVASLPANLFPINGAVDQSTHTLYVPLAAFNDTLDYVGVIDGSTCNAVVHSGCGGTPHLVQVGSLPLQVTIDPKTKTAYVVNEESSTLSVINTATCNGKDQSGCPQRAPALAVGVNPLGMDIDPKTHTLYASSVDTNKVWVLDASTCNGMNTSGCTEFAPTTTVGAEPLAVAENPKTKTVYATNQLDNTVSVIDATACNQDHLAGCNQTWPTIDVGTNPRFIGINKNTNTIYVSNFFDNTLSVINGATCNGKITSGCMQPQPTTPVGNGPEQVAVDDRTNTIYVANRNDNSVSVINGDVCNAGHLSGCNQSWPIVTVGASPQALAVNPNNHTVYVANFVDNTVSVFSALHCNATDSSGCSQTPAIIPVGSGPRSVGIAFDTDTVFVGNRDDLTVSVIDGSTCNGRHTTGCGQTPPAVLVGAFPGSAGNGNNLLGRSIAIKDHIIYIPNIGDSDVATLDGNTCRAGQLDGCEVKIVHKRMGGFPEVATVDDESGTVYVTNDSDGTVSVFPSSR